ncbi:MAG TPA: hypothetical protein P5077_08390 [bacterium]|nr:hypothetical protein [bacterium]
MIRLLALVALFLSCAACSSQPAPAWQNEGVAQLANFMQRYLEGDDRLAGIHFEKALEHISRTGDPALVGRLYLMRCALGVASLIDSPCEEATRYAGDPANDAYRAQMAGGAADRKALPPQYRDLDAAFAERSVAKVNAALDGIDEPLSRCIGAGLAVSRGLFDAATLETAARAASEQGWKRPLTAYLTKLRELYAAQGDRQREQETQRRLDIVSGTGGEKSE